MEQNFEKAFEFVIEHEGGYVNDPRDPGGETKYGISKKAYPDLDIKELTLEEAKEIYRRDYWDKLKCDEIASGLDIVALDTGINCGVNRVLGYLKLTHDWRDFSIFEVGLLQQSSYRKDLPNWVGEASGRSLEVGEVFMIVSLWYSSWTCTRCGKKHNRWKMHCECERS